MSSLDLNTTQMSSAHLPFMEEFQLTTKQESLEEELTSLSAQLGVSWIILKGET